MRLQRGGNGRNGDGSWPPTDGKGCPLCGAIRGGGHGGGCPNTQRYDEQGNVIGGRKEPELFRADCRLPDVTVHLSTGQDGNIFMILGAVCSAMRAAGYGDLTDEFTREMTDTPNYDAALQCVMRWVDVS